MKRINTIFLGHSEQLWNNSLTATRKMLKKDFGNIENAIPYKLFQFTAIPKLTRRQYEKN